MFRGMKEQKSIGRKKIPIKKKSSSSPSSTRNYKGLVVFCLFFLLSSMYLVPSSTKYTSLSLQPLLKGFTNNNKRKLKHQFVKRLNHIEEGATVVEMTIDGVKNCGQENEFANVGVNTFLERGVYNIKPISGGVNFNILNEPPLKSSFSLNVRFVSQAEAATSSISSAPGENNLDISTINNAKQQHKTILQETSRLFNINGIKNLKINEPSVLHFFVREDQSDWCYDNAGSMQLEIIYVGELGDIKNNKKKKLVSIQSHKLISKSKNGGNDDSKNELISVPSLHNIIAMWWETEKGKTISYRSNLILTAAVKSAVMYGEGRKVVVFSNTLPFDFFCDALVLKGWERDVTMPYTCQVIISRYNILDLASTLRNQNDIINVYNDIVGPEGQKDKKGYMHLISDMVRYLILYRYGGTYLDIDQILIKTLPNEKRVVAIEAKWNRVKCKNDPSWRVKGHKCGYVQMIEHPVPGKCANLDPEMDVSLYSSVLINFEVGDPVIERTLELLPKQYERHCWGCLGPSLITSAYSFACSTQSGLVGRMAEDNTVLIRGPIIEAMVNTLENKKALLGSVLEIDLHLQTNSRLLVGSLLLETLRYPEINNISDIDISQKSDIQDLPWLNAREQRRGMDASFFHTLLVSTVSSSKTNEKYCLVADPEDDTRVHTVFCNTTKKLELFARWDIVRMQRPGWRWSYLQNKGNRNCLTDIGGLKATLSPCNISHNNNNSEIGRNKLYAMGTFFGATEVRGYNDGHCLTFKDDTYNLPVFAHNQACVHWQRMHRIPKVKVKRQAKWVGSKSLSLISRFSERSAPYLDFFLKACAELNGLESIILFWEEDAGMIPPSIDIASIPTRIIKLDNANVASIDLMLEYASEIPSVGVLWIPDPIHISKKLRDINIGLAYWQLYPKKMVGFLSANWDNKKQQLILGNLPDYSYNLILFDAPVIFPSKHVRIYMDHRQHSYRMVAKQYDECAQFAINIIGSLHTEDGAYIQKVRSYKWKLKKKLTWGFHEKHKYCLQKYSKWFPKHHLPLTSMKFSIH